MKLLEGGSGRVRVKIDGLTSREDLLFVLDAGVDAVGFITGFPYSARDLSSEAISELLPLVRRASSVIVAPVESIPGLLDALSRPPDFFQTYEDVEDRSVLKGAGLLRAIHVEGIEAIREAKEAASSCDGIVLDSKVKGMHGGTGRTHDWAVSRRIRDLLFPKPILLAGGLDPENVELAVRAVRPFGVDVCSGVERSPGRKDPELVKRFVARAKDSVV